MLFAVVINSRAGRLMGLQLAEFCRNVGETLIAAGHEADVVVASDESLPAALAAAAESACDVVLVGGGDGTIGTAARFLVATGKPLGILPLGTMNMLARDLGVPLEPMEALKQVASGGVAEAIDVAEVNGLPFLCRSFIGLVPRLALLRERFRGKPWYRRLPGIVWSFLTVLAGSRRFRITIDTGNGPETFRTAAVVVSNNAIEEAFGRLPSRRSLIDGLLHLYILRYRTGIGLLWAGFRILMGAARDVRGVEARNLPALVVTGKHHLIKVAIDGEVHWLRSPLHYRVRPRALLVLRPGPGPGPGSGPGPAGTVDREEVPNPGPAESDPIIEAALAAGPLPAVAFGAAVLCDLTDRNQTTDVDGGRGLEE